MLMNKRSALAAHFAVTWLSIVGAARAGDPPAAELLFERKHLSTLDAGAEVTYRFERMASDPKMLGEPFSDSIRLSVTAVRSEGTRAVTLSVFTGERARTVQDLPDMSSNPLLVFFLDRAVNNMGHLAGGAKPYLKDRIRTAFKDTANTEAISISYAGKPAPAYRIIVTPFAADPNAARMLGYEGAQLTLLVSEDVPGHFVELSSLFVSPIAGAPRLEERIALVGSAGKP